MDSTIQLVFNIILIVLLGFGIIWGFMRGLKKTVSRGLFLIVTTLLLLLFTIPLTKLLLSIRINVNMDINGAMVSGAKSIEEIISLYIEQYLGAEFLANYPSVSKIILSLPIIFVGSIVYVVFFWLLKYLLLPINALFTKLIFSKKKTTENLGFASFKKKKSKNNEDVGKFIVKDDRTAQKTNEQEKSEIHIINNTTNLKALDSKEQEPKKVIKTKIRENKHRLLGALVGAVVGLIITFNTMIPVYGLTNILNKVNGLKVENISSDKSSADDYTNGLSTQIYDSYRSSVMSAVSEKSGMEYLGLKAFDLVTTIEIDGKEISLQSEVDNLIASTQEVDTFAGLYNRYAIDGNISAISQQGLDEILAQAHKVLDSCNKIKIIDTVSDYLVPVVSTYLLKNDIKVTNNPKINSLITSTLSSLTKNNEIDAIGQLNTLLDVVDYINEQKLLHKVITSSYTSIPELISTLDSDFGTKLTTKLFNLKLVDATLPQLYNIGFAFLDQVIHYGYTETEVMISGLKDIVSSILDQTIMVAKTLSTHSPVLLTLDTLTPLGELLNTIKTSGIVNKSTYDGLVSYATRQLITISSNIVPEDFVGVVNTQVLKNMSNVTDWKNEFGKINETLQILKDKDYGIIGTYDTEGNKINDKISIRLDEGVIENIGLALDKLEETVMFGKTFNDSEFTNGATPTVKILTSLLEYAKTQIEDKYSEDDTFRKFSNILDRIETNLKTCGHTQRDESLTSLKFYKNELKTIAPALIDIYEIINSGNIELSENLGVSLDKAKTGILCGKDTTLVILETTLDIISENILGKDFVYNDNESTQTIKDKIYKLFDNINANITSLRSNIGTSSDTFTNNSNFWTNEIKVFASLKDIAEKVDTISTIEDAIDLSSSLDEIYSTNSQILSKNSITSVLVSSIENLKFENTTTINIAINKLIDGLITNLKAETFADPLKDYSHYWAIEFGHIKRLYDINFEDSPGYSVIDNLNEIGNTLDGTNYGYAQGGSYTRHSYLITHNMLRTLISDIMSSLESNITSGFHTGTILSSVTNAVNAIKTNFNDTTNIPNTSFEKELGNLKILAKLDIRENLFDDTLALGNVAVQLDRIAYSVILDENTYTIKYNDDIDARYITNSKIITRKIIFDMIGSIMSVAKSGNITPTPTDKTIDKIKTELTNIQNSNKVITWANEMENIAILKQQISNKSFNAETALTFGVMLDAIAFNRKSDNTFNDYVFNSDGSIDYSKLTTSEDIYPNSVILTRDMLNAQIAETIKESTITGTNQSIIEDTLDSISNNIETNGKKIFSWEHELGKVKALMDLNETSVYSSTLDGEVNDSNPLIGLGKSIDAISFNVTSTNTYDDSTFDATKLTHIGTNSVVVSREILFNLVNSLLDSAKPTGTSSKDNIVNDILSNITGDSANGIESVIDLHSTTNANKYYSYKSAFTDLLNAKKKIENCLDNDIPTNLASINTTNCEVLDNTLGYLEDTKVCGVLVTRKLALEIAEQLLNEGTIQVAFTQPQYSECASYLNALKTGYDTKVSNKTTTAENYDTTKPFYTFAEKIANATTI